LVISVAFGASEEATEEKLGAIVKGLGERSLEAAVGRRNVAM